jgi:hypothetical protein
MFDGLIGRRVCLIGRIEEEEVEYSRLVFECRF